MFRFYLALWAAKLVNVLIGVFAPDRGSNYAGVVALKIDPEYVSRFKGIDYEKVLFITGTNGKSTTNNLIHHILKECGVPVHSNLEGANMLPGIARLLTKSSSLTGRAADGWFICETDERSIPKIIPHLPAANYLVINLTEDQVQRNGDPGYIFAMIRDAIPQGSRLYLNHDEPKAGALADSESTVVTFGVTRYHNSYPAPKDNVHTPCPSCYHPLHFDYFNNQGVGPYTCANCGYNNHSPADYEITQLDQANKRFSMDGQHYPMPLDLPYMIYNEAAAIAVARDLIGLEAPQIAAALENFTNIAGRYEVFYRGEKEIKSMRIKQENPETLQNVINVIASDPDPKLIVFALLPVEDFKPWYMNTAYLLSCNVDRLLDTAYEGIYHIGEAVSYDTYRFFKYLGVPDKVNHLIPESDIERLLEAIDREDCDNIYVVPSVNFYRQLVDQVKKGGLTTPCPERLRNY